MKHSTPSTAMLPCSGRSADMAKFKVAVQRTYVERIVFDIEAETEAEAKNIAFADAVPLADKEDAWEHVRNFAETLIVKE